MAEVRQKIISCPQGHYYDANKYQACPYCSEGRFSSGVVSGGSMCQQGDVGLRDARSQDASGTGCTAAPYDVRGQVTSARNDGVGSRPSDAENTGGYTKTVFVDDAPSGGEGVVPVVGWLVVLDGDICACMVLTESFVGVTAGSMPKNSRASGYPYPFRRNHASTSSFPSRYCVAESAEMPLMQSDKDIVHVI